MNCPTKQIERIPMRTNPPILPFRPEDVMWLTAPDGQGSLARIRLLNHLIQDILAGGRSIRPGLPVGPRDPRSGLSYFPTRRSRQAARAASASAGAASNEW